MEKDRSQRIISANEVGNFVVCPESWRLKFVEHESYRSGAEAKSVSEIRREWVQSQTLSSQLRYYARMVYYLLCLLTLIIFLFEARGFKFSGKYSLLEPFAERIQGVPTNLLLLLLVLGVIIFVWDLLERRRQGIQRSMGFNEKADLIALRGSDQLPAQKLISEQLGVSAKPDALIKEGGFILPVDRKPLSKKIRDRHIAQLLVQLRLVEEKFSKRPPYGLLLLGPTMRSVRVKNSPEKQQWLDSILEEMRQILAGNKQAVATPELNKCKRCDVSSACSYSAFHKSNTHRSGDIK